jgi:hypothetical protein
VCSPKITRGIKTNFDEGIEFFDDHQHHNQGIELYAKYFTHCDKKHDVVMDSSSNLSMYPQQVYDIYLQVDQSFMSRLKLITVVREPISRMFTNHRSKATSMPFDEYSKMLVQSSKFSPIEYGQHLKTWTSLFGRNQLLVLSYEELQTYPTRAQWRVQQFLEKTFEGTIKAQDSDGDVVSSNSLRILQPYFEKSNKEFYQFLDS